MNAEELLQRELAYYKKQVDKISGDAIAMEYAVAQLSNESKQFISGYRIIAEIQRSFSFYATPEILYEKLLDIILSNMSIDRVMILKIDYDNYVLQPFMWKGFTENLHEAIVETRIKLPDISYVNISGLVNSQTQLSEFELEVKTKLCTPFYILAPLVKNSQPWGILFSGRMNEAKPLAHLPLTLSNVYTFESLAGVISAMVQQLENHAAMEKERNRIARDMHDDIGSELSKISILCELLKQQYSQDYTLIEKLEKIKSSSGDVVDNLGNIVWALNPVNNNLEKLIAYLREYSYEYLEMNKIYLNFNRPQKITQVIIRHEIRSNIFMVVKEILHNIVKHSGAKNVKIDIGIDANLLSFKINDDGKGFENEPIKLNSNGLRNMKQRISECGGKLHINAVNFSGTEILFEIPF